MNLTFRRIRDAGTLAHERIVFRAIKAADLGDYAIFRASAKDNSVYAQLSNAFWFPDQDVKPDDLVVVYTKAGKQGRKENKDGSSSHFFYWGLDEVLWDTANFAPVLLEIASWQAFFPADFDQ